MEKLRSVHPRCYFIIVSANKYVFELLDWQETVKFTSYKII